MGLAQQLFVVERLTERLVIGGCERLADLGIFSSYAGGDNPRYQCFFGAGIDQGIRFGHGIDTQGRRWQRKDQSDRQG